MSARLEGRERPDAVPAWPFSARRRVVARRGQCGDACRREQVARRGGRPAKELLCGGTANAPLACAHAAARVQLGVDPAAEACQFGVRHVFAAADQGVRPGQGVEGIVQLVNVPSLGVLAEIVWLTTPAFINSTFT